VRGDRVSRLSNKAKRVCLRNAAIGKVSGCSRFANRQGADNDWDFMSNIGRDIFRAAHVAATLGFGLVAVLSPELFAFARLFYLAWGLLLVFTVEVHESAILPWSALIILMVPNGVEIITRLSGGG
jgi:hypothetical protein